MKKQKNQIEFVSYNGKYPCLCGGTLILKINEKTINFGDNCLRPGGYCNLEEDSVVAGPWKVEVPEKYEELKDEIEAVVNANVPFGCCGGCL